MAAQKIKEEIDAGNIKPEDREFIRQKLYDAAEYIRREYGLRIPVIRVFLHEMLDVSV